ncbi:hypothetical protein CBR_g4159 [Chara braunii]|uniref:Uncharacterized protein n=1 Tax=Chara braunii TaxID=69332 RepID=A0A388KHB6_CHABU|nr:hypothetical protein CBR_g4159 [Chara braunii]|eukprot:GBG69464.1 hypothetical protein CBR_g4159 [Chara braunii]
MGRFLAAFAVASLVLLATLSVLHLADATGAKCPCSPGTKRCTPTGPCLMRTQRTGYKILAFRSFALLLAPQDMSPSSSSLLHILLYCLALSCAEE